MTFASVTRLRPRSVRFLPGILMHTWRTRKQLEKADGFLGGYLATSPGLALWTITLWRDETAMRSFRNAQSHLRAMPTLIRACAEASVVNWNDAGEVIPEPSEAAERLKSGRTSKLRYPSTAHAAGDAWPDAKVPRKGPSL